MIWEVRIEKDQRCVSPGLVEEGGEKRQWDLVWEEHLQITGLLTVMLMSYSRVMKVFFVLWGVGAILSNESN